MMENYATKFDWNGIFGDKSPLDSNFPSQAAMSRQLEPTRALRLTIDLILFISQNRTSNVEQKDPYYIFMAMEDIQILFDKVTMSTQSLQ